VNQMTQKKSFIASEDAVDVKAWQPPAMQGDAINSNEVDRIQLHKELVHKKQQERIKKANLKPKKREDEQLIDLDPVYSEPVESEDIESQSRITAEALEEIRQAAFEEGRQEGYQHGLEQAEQEINQRKNELTEQAKLLGEVLDYLQEPANLLDDNVEKQILQLISLFVHKIVKREISIDPSHLIGIIREAAQYLPMHNVEPIVLELNSKDAKAIQALLTTKEEQSQWKIFENPTFQRGDIQLMSGNSTIDASVEHLLNQVISQAFGLDRQTPTSVTDDSVEETTVQSEKILQAEQSEKAPQAENLELTVSDEQVEQAGSAEPLRDDGDE